MVDVEHRALRALEEDAIASADRGVDHAADVCREREQALRVALERHDDRVDVRELSAEGRGDGRPGRERARDDAMHALAIAQVAEADASTGDLVLVGRSDPLLRRTDLSVGGGALAEGVDEQVVRLDQVHQLADEEPPLGLDPASRQRVELDDQRRWVDDHALGHGADRPGLQDAARDVPDDHLVVADDQGVAGVGPARVPDDQVRGLAQQVDDLALALIPPLGPDDDDG